MGGGAGKGKEAKTMKRKKVDSTLERQFLVAMITTTPFLAAVAPGLEPDLFAARYVATVSRWCAEYFTAYGEAPGRNIEPLYHAWVENDKPEPSDADAVSDFLESLSQSYEGDATINVPHLLDEMSTYVTLRRVQRLNDNLSAHLMRGEKEEAVRAITEFRETSLNERTGYNPARGRDHLRRAYAEPAESLLRFSGDAGVFFDPAFTRDSLIGIQGPQKRGKTWWCLEFVYRALRAHRKVCLFEVGDLSESQITKRMAVRMAGIPMRRSQCAGVMIPTEITLVDDPEGKGRVAEVQYRSQKWEDPLDEQSAYVGQKKFCRRHKISKVGDQVMFSVHPNSSINVVGIDAILSKWEYERDFRPDVCVIDYADILAPENPREEPRQRVNDTWKALRRLSQERHMCVIAPTQANAASYKTETQSMSNFSEDNRKLSHVTGMLALNQTAGEKEKGVMRLNWIVLRESEFHTSQCLYVAQCLALGQALVKAVK